jgi:hypothetical protein
LSAIQELYRSLAKLGARGTLLLIAAKQAKKGRIVRLLQNSVGNAILKIASAPADAAPPSESELAVITEKAEAMLRDENFFFTFIYKTKDIPDVWNFDPLEEKYWPKRHYEETRVHSADTPRDVKIVWEINRFKDLPILALAAYCTKEKKYADEIERRMLSWIEGNPFGKSVNWSSPLELAVRGISWTTSLRLLSMAGFSLHKNELISSAIWQHAAYIRAALSTDKIVRSNHLIGETAGLYILSSFFDFPEANEFRILALNLFQDSVLKQTYSDGVSKESSGWYHSFVTDFADVVQRTALNNDDLLSEDFQARFEKMSIYRNSIYATDGAIVKFGDFDNGKAIDLASGWRSLVFGASQFETTETRNIFSEAKHIAARIDTNYLFVRSGEFGWGGAGFSSHAHDDILAPVLYMHRQPILIDPGTYVYNGDPENRDKFRVAQAHNMIIVDGKMGVGTKSSFGWDKVRPPASIDFFTETEEEIIAEASYGEYKGEHLRRYTLTKERFVLEDHFEMKGRHTLESHFHFHPRWRVEKQGEKKFLLHDFRAHEFLFELIEGEGEFEVAAYDYSSSYMEKSPAHKLLFRSIHGSLTGHYRFEITRASR